MEEKQQIADESVAVIPPIPVCLGLLRNPVPGSFGSLCRTSDDETYETAKFRIRLPNYK